jgi:aryl-alcohol dehydrogenase-like predicted oxidoreductase
LLIRGRVIKELGLRRTDLIVTTKLFWGPRNGPNDHGLSRKQSVLLCRNPLISRLYPYSIIEGTKECLARLQLDYVDVIFAHRPDRTGACRSRFRSHSLTHMISSHGIDTRFHVWYISTYSLLQEEVVRAFNHIIEKGQVLNPRHRILR